MSAAPETRREIRSFVRRSGRIGGYRAEILKNPPDGALFNEETLPKITSEALFGNDRPLIVEIGFGMGDATVIIACENPQNNYLAIDVHRPGIGKLLSEINDRQLENLKAVEGDAQRILNSLKAAAAAVDGFHIFFPDPWQKKRHRKRRLITDSFVRRLTELLKPNGYILAATDWSDYAEQIQTVLSSFPELKNSSRPHFERLSQRPMTKFEKKGLEKGHRIFDFFYVKRSAYVGQ